ncbi:unnamed protein product [Moneuplotes crassus]|uniref:Golgin subfamily A member 7/ERF4 domain-containing protein n=1 Tax=Euplotes crassus TaxID=5936 RepID=A0AAD1XYZ1_EUPCR|nr:unnamed protein product [Moneuplotes crassus]
MRTSDEDEVSNPEILHIIKPVECPFFTGIAHKYDDRYPEEKLAEYIPEDEYKQAIGRINDILHSHWPCDTVYYGCGFVLGYMTCGLACLLPWQCIKGGKKQLLQAIDFMNIERFLPHGLFIEYHEFGCHRSCFYIRTKTERDMEQLEKKDEQMTSLALQKNKENNE